MARIKIKDLPEDHQINKQEMKKVFGGIQITTSDYFSGIKPPVAIATASAWPT